MPVITWKNPVTFLPCVALCTVAIAVNLGACSGSTDDNDAPSAKTDNDPENNQPIGGIVDIRGDNNAFDLLAFTDNETENALANQNELGILATTTSTYYCNSPDPMNIDAGFGSISYTHVDEDPPGQSTGDSYSTVYDNCDQVTRSMNGFSSFTIDEQTGIPYQPGSAWTLTTTAATDLTLLYANGEQVIQADLTYSTGTADGVVFTRSVNGTNSQSIMFDGIGNSSSGIYTISIDSNITTREYSKNIDISRTGAFGVRMTKTLQPLVGINGPADSGILQITTTNPAGQTSVATYTGLGGGAVLEEIDLDNDGVIDSSQETTWAAVPHY